MQARGNPDDAPEMISTAFCRVHWASGVPNAHTKIIAAASNIYLFTRKACAATNRDMRA